MSWRAGSGVGEAALRKPRDTRQRGRSRLRCAASAHAGGLVRRTSADGYAEASGAVRGGVTDGTSVDASEMGSELAGGPAWCGSWGGLGDGRGAEDVVEGERWWKGAGRW